MSKKELAYQELAGALLEGMCKAVYDLFDCKIKHKELDIEDQVGIPLEVMKNMWVSKMISDYTGIDLDTLVELANEGRDDDDA